MTAALDLMHDPDDEQIAYHLAYQRASTAHHQTSPGPCSVPGCRVCSASLAGDVTDDHATDGAPPTIAYHIDMFV